MNTPQSTSAHRVARCLSLVDVVMRRQEELFSPQEKSRALREMKELLRRPVGSADHPELNRLLEQVVLLGCPPQTVAWCVAAGADPNQVVSPKDNETLLHQAALKSPFDVVLALIQVGASPAKISTDGVTAWQLLLEKHLLISASSVAAKYREVQDQILDALFATQEFVLPPPSPPVWWMAASHASLPLLKRFHAAGVDLTLPIPDYPIFSAFRQHTIRRLLRNMSLDMLGDYRPNQHFHDMAECAQWLMDIGAPPPGEEVMRQALDDKNEPLDRWLHGQGVRFPEEFVLLRAFDRPLPLTHYVVFRYHPSESMAQWLLSVIPRGDWSHANKEGLKVLRFLDSEQKKSYGAGVWTFSPSDDLPARIKAWAECLGVLEEKWALTDRLAKTSPSDPPARKRL